MITCVTSGTIWMEGSMCYKANNKLIAGIKTHVVLKAIAVVERTLI